MNADNMESPWIAVCELADIVPNTGVCALVDGNQVAVFHLEPHGNEGASQVFAIDNFDPASQAAVLSRGLIGNLGERIVVASPIYKQHFDLQTGECLEAPEHSVAAYEARIDGGTVWVSART